MKVLFAESHNLDRPDPVGSHHYIRLFKEAGHECLWLGPAVSPMHIFKADSLNRYRFKIWKEGIREIGGIKWLVPFCLLFYYNQPLLRSLYVGRNQYRFSLPPLKGQLERAGFSPVDLLWCAGPVALGLLDLVPHKLSCYRLADRLDQFSAIPADVEVLQRELIRRVDFVMATSRSLWDWARSIREEGVYYLPNGVSESFFKRRNERPADFPANSKPKVIYSGTLDTRFDLDTLAQAVREMPDLHFLLIGALTFDALKPGIAELGKRDNFTWLGSRDYRELPAYLEGCAVGVIPFYLNKLTEAVNPIKYYEYLAAGLPVVAPEMRELTGMQGPVHLYRSADQFCLKLREAIRSGKENREELTGFASDHTWQARFTEIEKIIRMTIS